MKVNILGTKYDVLFQKESENPKLETANGLCEYYSKKVIVNDYEPNKTNFENIGSFKRRVLRHEIVHAFLAESGLRGNCDWADNEEMVDWIAIQLPKLYKACIEANALQEGD